MSIFNSLVGGAEAAGFEVESGTVSGISSTTIDIPFANSHSNPPFFVSVVESSGAATSPSSSWDMVVTATAYFLPLFFDEISYASPYRGYGLQVGINRSGGTSSTGGIYYYPSRSSGTSSYYYGTFVDAKRIYGYVNSTMRYCGDSYDWIAIWK